MNAGKQEKSLVKDPWFWLAMLLAGGSLSPTLWFGLAMDQSIYAYGAWVWKWFQSPPYLGVWDQNFPGIFIVHRAAMALFGDSIFGFRLFDFLVQLGCLAMVFWLARKLAGLSSAGFMAAIIYAIYYYGLGQMPTGEREAFVFALFLLSTALFYAIESAPRLRAVLIGLLLGFAFLLKPVFGLAWPVFGAWILWVGKSAAVKKNWTALALFALSCLGPSLAVIFYYWRLGGLDEFYRAVIWYNFAVYAKMSPSFFVAPGLTLSEIYRDLFKDQRVILWFGIAGLLFSRKAAADAGRKNLFALVSLLMLSGLLSYLVQGKFFSYHLIPFWGFMAVFAGAGAAGIGKWLRGLNRAAGPIFLAAVIVLMLWGLSRPMREFPFKFAFAGLDRGYLAELGRYDGHLAANYYLAAKELETRLSPGDRVEFFGPYPLVNFVLKKRLPSRFPCVQSLLLMPRNGERPGLQSQWIREYSDAVIAARPRFFLISDYFPGRNNRLFNMSSTSLKQALESDFPELDRFLKENYRLVGDVGRVEIFEMYDK